MRGGPWWENEKEGSQHQVVFVQVDVSGSSKWLVTEGSNSVCGPLRQFAELAKEAAENANFDRLFWAGDGGVFCQKWSGGETSAVFFAVDEIFQSFSALRSYNADLNVRVTATIAPFVISYRDASNMCSSRLSAFIKFERQIALNGAFVITDDLYKCMDRSHRRVTKLTKHSDQIQLPSQESITRWVDAEHPYEIVPSKRSFRGWLSAKDAAHALPTSSVTVASLPPQLVSVGESIVLDVAPEPSGYGEINLRPLASKAADEIIQPTDEQTWSAAKAELVNRNERGVKLTVAYFQGEFSDHPHAELGWRQGHYEDAKAFNTLLEAPGGQRIRDRYLSNALAIEREERYTLGLLGNFVVVLLQAASNGREVLIAHRRKRLREGGRRGGFFNNSWSASMEEQFRPIEEVRDGKRYPADSTIRAGIVRGVREEFLGSEYAGPMSIAVHAFILETTNLNYAFLSIVDLPELSFEELCALWPAAEDSTEHDALAVLPLRADVLAACMTSNGLPPTVWHELSRNGKQLGGDALSAEDHAWHPSSAVRLAMALWHLDNLK